MFIGATVANSYWQLLAVNDSYWQLRTVTTSFYEVQLPFGGVLR